MLIKLYLSERYLKISKDGNTCSFEFLHKEFNLLKKKSLTIVIVSLLRLLKY